MQRSPFFSDDSEGVFKLVAGFVTFAGIILGGFWKIASSKLTRDTESQADELDGLGGRVDDLKESDTKAHTRIDELVRRADARDIEIREITGDIGRLEAKVDHLLAQGTENKLEIIGEFQRAANEMRDGLHALELRMERVQATIDERERADRARGEE